LAKAILEIDQSQLKPPTPLSEEQFFGFISA
jgi:hypothetical protein